jgi:hypothetical protein
MGIALEEILEWRLLLILLSGLLWNFLLAPLDYKEDLEVLVWHLQGTKKYLGRLDAAGNFIAEDTFGFPLNSPLGIGKAANARITNAPSDGMSERAYEYRSGRLVKGTLVKDGHFVPDKGSSVIPFEKYVPIRGNLRIYNLPGRFVERVWKP